jgi:uncharacterized surface protein with fasciclin (FAS1) repeats
MKKILIIVLLCSTSFAFAQKADSVNARIAKARNVDGTMMSPARNLIDNISSSPQLSILVKIIDSAGLADNLKTGTITFFAPANQAFDKLPAGTLDTLFKAGHKSDLINLVNDHTVQGRFTSKDIARLIKAGDGQAALTTLAGGTLTARVNENRNIVLTDDNSGQSIITRLDIEQSNGILFIVNAVLQPKPKQ